MLTPSVNVVQSAFPEEQQGEISGLSRSVSNLGSSLGTAIAGTILVSDLASGTGLTPWRWPHWRDRAHRLGRRAAASFQSRATAGLMAARPSLP
jgi:hypothetical protein